MTKEELKERINKIIDLNWTDPPNWNRIVGAVWSLSVQESQPKTVKEAAEKGFNS